MTSTLTLRLLGACTVAALAACSAGGARSPGAQVTIASAPLVPDDGATGATFDPILKVCYGLSVYNGIPNDGDTVRVWSNDEVCSSEFGNAGAGAITYVGPCDASAQGDNYIVLSINEVRTFNGVLEDQDSGASDPDFKNPCTHDHPCVQHFQCQENKDVLVSYDLTIMRDADQGFFDIAVNFEDVFCSAKVDTCYDPTHPIELLHGPGGDREHTAVAAVACTAGPDTDAKDLTTELLFTSRTITCDGDVVFHLDPAIDGSPPAASPIFAGAGGKTVMYQNYFGAEELECGSYPCNKTYYNTAIDIAYLADQGLTGCKLSFYATAHVADGDDGFDRQSGLFGRLGGLYAAVRALDVPLTDGVGGTVCDAHPLDGRDLAGGASLVTSEYIGSLAETNPAFCYASLDGAAMAALPCAPTTTPTGPVCLPGCIRCSDDAPGLVCDRAWTGENARIQCHGSTAELAGYDNLRLWLFAGGYGGGRYGGGGFGGGTGRLGYGSGRQELDVLGQAGTDGTIQFASFGDFYGPSAQFSTTSHDGQTFLAATFLTCLECADGLVLLPTGDCGTPPPVCDANCQVCGDWHDDNNDINTLHCVAVENGEVKCDGIFPGGASGSADLYVQGSDAVIATGTVDDDGHLDFPTFVGSADLLYYYGDGKTVYATTGGQCTLCADGYLSNALGVCTQPDSDCPENCLSCRPFSIATLACTSPSEGQVECTLSGGVADAWYFLYSGEGDFLDAVNSGADTTVVFGPLAGSLDVVYAVGTADENDQTVIVASTQEQCIECGAPYATTQFGFCTDPSGPQ